VHPWNTLLPNWFNNDEPVQIKSVTRVLSRNTESAILVTELGIVATVVPLPLTVTLVITLFEIS